MREPIPATGRAGGLVATDQWRLTSLADVSIWAAYAALGSALCWTRLVGIDRSLWLDEVITVQAYVREGPGAILAGPYLLNNHELFSLLAWITTSSLGESEIALRFWSVVPFLAGVAITTAWLHVRVSRLSALLFLFLATGSPLLLDITPTARGYGLAFLAMSVVVVSALEVERSRSGIWLLALFTAGVAGVWTLPNFAIAFFATSAVLLFDPGLRRRVAVGILGSAFAAVAWYAPHLGSVSGTSRQEYGVQVEALGLLTAPIDHVFVPALLWQDGVVPADRLVLFPIAVLTVVVMAASPLLRPRRSAAVLVSGVIVTMLVFWYLRLNIVPRFSSHLLVPMFMLAASGAASILTRRTSRISPRAPLVIAAISMLGFVFALAIHDVSRLPREANKDAAMLIHAEAPAASRIYSHAADARGLAFYLGTPVERPASPGAMCAARAPVVLVYHPFRIRPLAVPCLDRTGVRHYRFEQYARGGEMNVWLIPPR